jgi:hypothetical protein
MLAIVRKVSCDVEIRRKSIVRPQYLDSPSQSRGRKTGLVDSEGSGHVINATTPGLKAVMLPLDSRTLAVVDLSLAGDYMRVIRT